MAAVCRVVFSAVVATMAATAIGFGQGPAQKPNPESAARAEQVLVEARKALGGDKLAAIKTLTATGRTRRVRGDNLVPIEFEILIELPDKYVRIDEFPAEDMDPTSSGFNGDALIQLPLPPAGSPPAGGPGRGMAPAGPSAPPGAAAPAPGPPPGAAPPSAPGAGPGGAMPGGRGPVPGGRGPAPDPR